MVRGRHDCDDRAAGVVGHTATGSTGNTLSAVDLDPAPLVDVLGEIRDLHELRHRGQITAVEYDRRRRRLLEKI